MDFNSTLPPSESIVSNCCLGNSFLKEAPEEFLNVLPPYSERVKLTAGENLYLAGSMLEYLYFPETAVISEIGILEDGRTVETAMLGKESVVGLSAGLSGTKTSRGIRVLIGGNALRMKVCIFRQVFKQSNALQIISLNYLNRHLNQVSQNLLCHSYHSVKQHFCCWLLTLYQKNEERQFVLTHEQIADHLGVHRPSLSQAARKLQNDRIIDYIRGKLSILDVDRLQELSCECHQRDDC